MHKEIKQLTDLLLCDHHMDVDCFDEAFLLKTVRGRMTESKCSSEDEYLKLIKINREEASHLFDSLHIGYSEFFRDPLTFSVLEQIILPTLAYRKHTDNHREIRIWSAACSAGQEAYSLAILLEELRNGSSTKFNYRIFATDTSEKLISDAKKASYVARNLNNITFSRVKQWFTSKDDIYSLHLAIMKHIEFTQFDLFNKQLVCPPGSIFGEFDIIFCANLLFYYKADYREIILDKVRKSLAPNGFLVTGDSERDIVLKHGFKEVFPGISIFQG